MKGVYFSSFQVQQDLTFVSKSKPRKQRDTGEEKQQQQQEQQQQQQPKDDEAQPQEQQQQPENPEADDRKDQGNNNAVVEGSRQVRDREGILHLSVIKRRPLSDAADRMDRCNFLLFPCLHACPPALSLSRSLNPICPHVKGDVFY